VHRSVNGLDHGRETFTASDSCQAHHWVAEIPADFALPVIGTDILDETDEVSEKT
jgi:hypothetical protein